MNFPFILWYLEVDAVYWNGNVGIGVGVYLEVIYSSFFFVFFLRVAFDFQRPGSKSPGDSLNRSGALRAESQRHTQYWLRNSWCPKSEWDSCGEYFFVSESPKFIVCNSIHHQALSQIYWIRILGLGPRICITTKFSRYSLTYCKLIVAIFVFFSSLLSPHFLERAPGTQQVLINICSKKVERTRQKAKNVLNTSYLLHVP